jgi:hypothetical protein
MYGPGSSARVAATTVVAPVAAAYTSGGFALAAPAAPAAVQSFALSVRLLRLSNSTGRLTVGLAGAAPTYVFTAANASAASGRPLYVSGGSELAVQFEGGADSADSIAVLLVEALPYARMPLPAIVESHALLLCIPVTV